MANEFRIKHGLIITGSSYFSESMFAPNLPEETSPQYYITWRQSDGRFEVSTGTNSVQDTLACWDYASGDVTVGEWNTDNGAVGSSTSIINIHKTDNNSVDQSNFLNSLGPGSVIILYVGSNSTTFTVNGVSQNGNIFSLNVTYTSGNEYSVTGTPEMCLGVGVAISSNTGTSINCLEFEMVDDVNDIYSNNGKAALDRVSGSTHWQTPLGTVNGNVVGILLNGTDKNLAQSVAFFHNYQGEIEIGYKQYATKFQTTTNLTSNAYQQTVYVTFMTYVSGDTNYTISTGDSFTLCKSSR